MKPPRPAADSPEIRRQRSLVRDLEWQIEDLQGELDEARDALYSLEQGHEAWPDKDTLLAVYGAPGNWPVQAA